MAYGEHNFSTTISTNSTTVSPSSRVKPTVTARGDGTDSAGTLFPRLAVKSQFETLDNQTGTVTIVGCNIGDTYIWEILGSARDVGKDCTSMTYWVGNSTGTVSTVGNTDTLVTLTNTCTSSTQTLYCTASYIGGDSFLNAIKITSPAGTALDDRYVSKSTGLTTNHTIAVDDVLVIVDGQITEIQ